MAMRVAALVLFVVLSGGMVGAAELGPEPAQCPAAHEPSGRVVEAIDGDTLRLEDGTLVRLAGIDAPDPALDPVAGTSASLAQQARARLAGVTVGQNVGLAPIGATRDRHGRQHAFVTLPDGTSLQSQMLGAGLAVVHILPGEDGCGDQFLADEKRARSAALGIWAGHAAVIRTADDPSLLDKIGLYELVEGRVVSVGRRSRLVFLDFGRNWRSDFTVMVELAAADRMAKSGVPVESLVKRRIRVRGVIEESGGPAIRIAEPSAIELLDE